MNNTQGKIGLLPLYLELYDEVCAKEETDEVRAFADVVEAEYVKRGVEVVTSSACRNAEEFAVAVKGFEEAGVDAIVSLHLAYSPSLESADIIAATALPLIVLDTTPDASFGLEQETERVMFNHGIHGVQDFCNLLLRRGKAFALEAGHWQGSDVLDRTVAVLQGLRAAAAFRQAKVGLVGEPFAGMGDFSVPPGVLRDELGIEIVRATSEEIAARMPAVDSEAVAAEIEADLNTFAPGEFTEESLRVSEAAGLGLRAWIEEKQLSAMTVNFQYVTGAPGLPVAPFLEASKAMARGLGYGGEGDVLTAALCGAMRQVCRPTTFTEMFCPDWVGGRIFMSHMGEANIDVLGGAPVLEQRPYPFSPAGEPVIAAGCLQGGAALLLNAAPLADDRFRLIAVPVEMEATGGNETIASGIRGWLKPPLPVDVFLKEYSLNGGTHHKVLCYGMALDTARTFAAAMGWEFCVIDERRLP